MKIKTIYLNNASTSWPKPDCVYDKMYEVLRNLPGSAGRGSSNSTLKADKIVLEARKEIAALFNTSNPSNVIFTLNGTDALNIAIKGLVKPSSKVIIGPFEHNSVIRPLNSIISNSNDIKVAKMTLDYNIDLESFKTLCNDGIDFAIISHASNVIGNIINISEISKIVHSSGGLLILDAAQSAGITSIDMKEMGIDILAAPGHKGLFGPMGTGILILAEDFPIEPFREGGTGILSVELSQPDKLPYRLEAGTNNLPGIAGLLEGVRFIQKTGLNKISYHKQKLTLYLISELEKIEEVNLFCNKKNPQSGVVSFTVDPLENSLIENILDQIYNIQIRSGLHCSPSAHCALGTYPSGTIRVSLSYFNNFQDIDILISALKSIIQSTQTK